MMHLIILILVVLLAWQTVILVGRVIWLAVLIVAWCVLAGVTMVLGLAIGVHKLTQVVDEWRWRRRYGEILPPQLRYET
jgi:hypothetical protein